MKKLALLFSIIVLAAGSSLAQTSGFTYQGKLGQSGAPANGSYDLQFTLWDAASGGTPQPESSPELVTRTGVAVANGVFTVPVDFSAECFPAGADRWLEISVRLSGTDDDYTVLSPRQQMKSVPFAVRSLTANNADNAVNAQNLNGVAASQYVQSDGNFNISGDGTIVGTLTAGTFNGNGSGLKDVRGTLPWKVVTGTSEQAQPNTGYVANNIAEVTITLPTAPNVGDIVRVSGGGTGGWKITQNPSQTIVVTTLEKGWTPRESNRTWRSVASSADGTKLVAGVNDGQIYTSTDSGVTWVPRDTNRVWYSIASSADGTKLVAVVASGRIYTSTDSGVTWEPRETNRAWRSVASSADGSKLVAVVSSGQIYTSIDSGVTWGPRESNRSWRAVASSADGSKLVAVVFNGDVYTSTDFGMTWMARERIGLWVSVASSADGGKLVALTDQIHTSTDSGLTWTIRESAENVQSVKHWTSVASSADGGSLVASVDGGQIYTSRNSGMSWTAQESNRDWSTVASSADGNKLVALVQFSGQIYTSKLQTILGGAGSLSGTLFGAVELQYIGGGRFLILSHEGTFIVN